MMATTRPDAANDLSAAEATQYDRQIRLWGVDAQKKYVVYFFVIYVCFAMLSLWITNKTLILTPFLFSHLDQNARRTCPCRGHGRSKCRSMQEYCTRWCWAIGVVRSHNGDYCRYIWAVSHWSQRHWQERMFLDLSSNGLVMFVQSQDVLFLFFFLVVDISRYVHECAFSRSDILIFWCVLLPIYLYSEQRVLWHVFNSLTLMSKYRPIRMMFPTNPTTSFLTLTLLCLLMLLYQR